MRPSNFAAIYPWNSITNQAECEIVAKNIMAILKRTGDTFRNLSWEEYKKERLKDGNFSSIEKKYFCKVKDYCISEEAARQFSPKWKAAKVINS